MAEYDSVEVEPSGVVAALSKQEMDTQIATSHRFPRFHRNRGIEDFQRDILRLATADEETARSMFYRLKRKGRDGKDVIIEGPSVRMAEVVAACWKNLHISSRPGGEQDGFITGQAVAWDLESNYRVGTETRRRITDRQGRRYSDDMITTTVNAAMAIAWRNACLKVVPGALLKAALEQAKEVSLGKGLTMEAKRKKAMDVMAKVAGAKPAEILRVLGRHSELDITIDDLVSLHGYCTAIKEGETTWKEIYAASAPPADVEVVPDNLPKGAQQAGDAVPGGDPEATLDAQTQGAIMNRWKVAGGTLDEMEAKLTEAFGACDLSAFKYKHLAAIESTLGLSHE